jgi:hypothetical protein
MAKVFFSYSHDDEQYRDQLEKHLAMLKREGLIESWHDRRIRAGSPLAQEIDRQLEQADVVLLLVSASFLASDYCYGIEMRRAMERHAASEATVIPVIARPCDWKSAPFGKLMAVPRDGKAIVTWANYDEAYTDVARRVREVVEAKAVRKASTQRGQEARPQQAATPMLGSANPRSSNMRLRKTFTEADKDNFLHEAFEYMAKFVEDSLQELQERHGDIECRFRRIDANTFTTTIYRAGERKAECAIHLGGEFRRGGITYSNDASSRGNSFNEELSVENDDQTLFLKPLGMSFRGAANAKLSAEQGAELFWEMLIGPLQ